ncbi:DASH complex subunit Dad2 [Phaffia rhodozyma]|uniref:DASH complex subunit DAD2 n=1 Tax=Phaffia rhodozyma TaxID=264483 RepID=A0A0F7SI71_PHARH|nr:DASH complex subunit Dad2 [Phaffia rhodozyma]
MSKLQEILHEKQQETLLYKQLVAVSASLTEQAQRLADSADIMADGGVAVASVMANWGQVFRIINVCDPISNPPPMQDASSSNQTNSHLEADESIANESLTGRPRRTSGSTGEDEEVEPVPMLVRMELEAEGVQGE